MNYTHFLFSLFVYFTKSIIFQSVTDIPKIINHFSIKTRSPKQLIKTILMISDWHPILAFSSLEAPYQPKSLQMENQNDRHHIIEITQNPENIPSIPTTQASSTTSKIHRVWIIFQLLVCVCQIMVSIVILWWSKIHENPENRRVVWLVGYTSGCLALLPLIYLSYRIEGAMMNRCVFISCLSLGHLFTL